MEIENIKNKENYIAIIDADKSSNFHYKKIKLKNNNLSYSKLVSIILMEYDLETSKNLRVFNFHEIEILDDSDLLVNFENHNNRVFYFTYYSRTSNKILINCFSKIEKLGEGGFGKVYLSKQIFSGEKYAIKYVKMSKSKSF